MDQSQLKWIADFIWNIADDHLRDVYVRGKYRDVILLHRSAPTGRLAGTDEEGRTGRGRSRRPAKAGQPQHGNRV